MILAVYNYMIIIVLAEYSSVERDTMNRNKALTTYLTGTIGQIAIVSIAAFLLRQNGIKVGYSTPIGWGAIALGGISSALWGTIVSIKYHKTNFKKVAGDFLKIKQNLKNYGLMLIFLCLDFLPVAFGGGFSVPAWYTPILMFFLYIAFGGLEEIGWRYTFQPILQERMHYVPATLLTFASWGTWHFLFFYIDETKADAIPFLIGLLTNSFILSALYGKTKNLWLCAMTHSLINVLATFSTAGNRYVEYVSKIVIITLAIVLVTKEQKK